jgi:hypothetical protein
MATRQAAITMTTSDAFAPDPASPLSLRLLLLLTALAELVDSASSVPALFMDHSRIPGPSLGGAIILTAIALKPPLAVAAIGGALIKRMRLAVCALAGVSICTWFNYLPSVASYGLDLRYNWSNLQTFADAELVLPIALAAIFLALRTGRLNWAVALACLPTAIRLAGLIAFFMAVSIHGF